MHIKYLYSSVGTVGKFIHDKINNEINQFTLHNYKNAGSCIPVQGTKITRLVIVL
jgi:hypothetical protein